MNQEAHDAVERAWELTIKTRALCPFASEKAIGLREYSSPGWYRQRGEKYVVKLPKPLTENDLEEMERVGTFVNGSFIISLASILEAHGVIHGDLDSSKDGAAYVQLTKWLRNRFAHGDWEPDYTNDKHVETRKLLEKLFPEDAAQDPGYPLSIDSVLEPLKDNVLAYIRAAT